MPAPHAEAAIDSRMTIEAVNALDREAFTDRFGGVYEDSSWIAKGAWEARPFASRAALEAALAGVTAAAGPERQIQLIRAHPDLVGRAALAGTLSRDSTTEQAAAGLDRDALTVDDIAAFTELNRAYRERFDFPFVICAREKKKDAILAGFRSRLTHTREEEITTALREIRQIAHHRLRDLVQDDDPTKSR